MSWTEETIDLARESFELDQKQTYPCLGHRDDLFDRDEDGAYIDTADAVSWQAYRAGMDFARARIVERLPGLLAAISGSDVVFSFDEALAGCGDLTLAVALEWKQALESDGMPAPCLTKWIAGYEGKVTRDVWSAFKAELANDREWGLCTQETPFIWHLELFLSDDDSPTACAEEGSALAALFDIFGQIAAWDDAEDVQRGLAAARKAAMEAYPAPKDSATCRVCGCWEGLACFGGCRWIEPNLCSKCESKA